MVLKFKFKGNRDYVHGTDMISKFLDVHKNVSKFSIRIKKMTTKNLSITQEISNQTIVAIISIEEPHEAKEKYYLTETDTYVDGNYPYDEESLLSNSKVFHSKEEITMNLHTSYNLIENLVALHKKLVLEVVSSDVKWLFVGMKLERMSETSNSGFARLKIDKKLSNKLIKSIIYLNGKQFGSISFSSIKKDKNDRH